MTPYTQEWVDQMNARRERGRTELPLDVPKPSRKPDAAEAKVRAEILDYCKSKGWLVFTGSTAHKTKRVVGEPDLCVVMPEGRVLWCEVKGKGGKPTIEQLGIGRWLQKLGHAWCCVWSFEEFELRVGEHWNSI